MKITSPLFAFPFPVISEIQTPPTYWSYLKLLTLYGRLCSCLHWSLAKPPPAFSSSRLIPPQLLRDSSSNPHLKMIKCALRVSFFVLHSFKAGENVEKHQTSLKENVNIAAKE